MMKCKQALSLMERALDGVIRPSETALLDKHLASCERCRAEYCDLMEMDRSLSEALPLQQTLGDGFAAKVMDNIPERRSRLSILKEAFQMSRLKYAVASMIILLLAAYFLFPSQSFDARAFAAVQDAMGRVKSVHWIFNAGHGDDHEVEIWTTPEATKQEFGNAWTLVKDGKSYGYFPQANVMLIGPKLISIPLQMFEGMIDPRSVTRYNRYLSKSDIRTSEVVKDGQPMLKVEIVSSPKTMRLASMVRNKVEKIANREISTAKRERILDVVDHLSRVKKVKTVFLADKSTHLVRSLELYIPASNGKDWMPIGKTTMVEYDLDIPSDFFNLPDVPKGTKKVDLSHYRQQKH